jgi:polyisoprenyl-phosphate glycosyltransferase
LFGGMVQWLGFRTGYVDVDHPARPDGKSSYTLRSLLTLAFDGIVAFSNRPLYLSITIGIVMSALAGLYGAYLLLNFLLSPQIAVPGWLSIITMMAFIGGLILLNLGMLGIYVGKIYDQTKGRPLYVIDSVMTEDYRELASPPPQVFKIEAGD